MGDKPSPVLKFTFYYGNKIEIKKDGNKKKTGFTENQKQVNSKGRSGYRKTKIKTSTYRIKKHDFT